MKLVFGNKDLLDVYYQSQFINKDKMDKHTLNNR